MDRRKIHGMRRRYRLSNAGFGVQILTTMLPQQYLYYVFRLFLAVENSMYISLYRLVPYSYAANY